MGVQDGFPVNASYTNPRFISKNINDVMPFELGFTYAPAGADIASIQAAVNKLYNATGASESTTGTVYNATAGTIANGDDYETALTILADKFAPVTGHLHTGAAGDGPLLPASSLTDFSLLGYIEQGSNISGATGTSTNVTSLLAGKSPSTGLTEEGVCVNTGPNKVRILSAATATGYRDITDSSGNLVYGRLTESAGTWTLSYYSQILSVQTAYTFAAPQDLFWWYQELFAPNETTSVYDPVIDLLTAGGGGSGGVTSVAASGFTAATGAIVLVEGTGIDLSQTGVNITIAVDASALSPLTTKGDIFGYSTVNARIPVGVDGQDLIPDSNQTLGVRYADSTVKNYVRINSDADVSIGSWATFADAASNIPADGTGGSPNITWTRTTTVPLENAGSFLFTKSGAANRQGQGASLAFSLSNACQGQVIALQCDLKVVSGTFTAGNGITAPLNDGTTTTNAGNSDLEFFVYDVTNSALIPVTPQTITSNSAIEWQFKGIFQTPSNSTSYRLIVYQATATTNDYTVQFDNFFVGRQAVSYGYAGGDWIAYTPTFTGYGTPTSVQFYWRRVGDSLEIQGTFTSGTVSATQARISFPSGLTSDSTKMSSAIQVAGFMGRNTASAAYFAAYSTIQPSVTYLTMSAQTSALNALSNNNADDVFSTGNNLTVNVRGIPIAGWSSNVLMSNDASTRVATAKAIGSPASASSGNPIIAPTIAFDTHAGYNTTTGRYTVPVSGFWKVYGFINSSNASVGLFIYKNGVSNTRCGYTGVIDGEGTWFGQVQCVAGDILDIRPDATLAGGADTNLNFELLTGPASIAASDKVFLQYTGNAGTVLTANVTNIDFTTKVVDSSLAWSGTVFTAPRAGWYNMIGSVAFTAGVAANIRVYINTVQKFNMSSGVSDAIKNITGAAYLLAGDLVSFRSDTNATLTNSAVNHWISISSQ